MRITDAALQIHHRDSKGCRRFAQQGGHAIATTRDIFARFEWPWENAG
jgi:hypothetical protein